jgi:ATPase subunit of ABC transporter with duplicated ATPase domains
MSARAQPVALKSPGHLQVHSLTVRVKGKVLLENTNVTITAGRRYGLAGPNGMGKSTLLRLLARRQVRHSTPGHSTMPLRVASVLVR